MDRDQRTADPSILPAQALNDGHQDLLARLHAVEAERDRLRSELRSARDAVNGDLWFWQGDGEDHLESLACPVLIWPEELAALLR